uniref:Uncharacterized protein n=1 Tax=Caenorhabditis japonica TaxID=281687 RepID=A0A8R1DM88_CAEJA
MMRHRCVNDAPINAIDSLRVYDDTLAVPPCHLRASHQRAKAPSEQANDSGEEPFSSTEVGKGSSALGWNKVLWSDESKYLMIGTDGVTLVRRPVDKRYDPKNQVPTVKHGGGNVMMWG